MSQNKLVINTAAFIAELRNMPADLTGEGAVIVMDAAILAKSTIGAVYEEHIDSGNLAKGLTLNVEAIGPFGSAAVVRSRAPHAYWFEKGTKTRKWASGKNTGKMWGSSRPTFIVARTAVRVRRGMYEKLRALMQRKGFVVTGSVE